MMALRVLSAVFSALLVLALANPVLAACVAPKPNPAGGPVRFRAIEQGKHPCVELAPWFGTTIRVEIEGKGRMRIRLAKGSQHFQAGQYAILTPRNANIAFRFMIEARGTEPNESMMKITPLPGEAAVRVGIMKVSDLPRTPAPDPDPKLAGPPLMKWNDTLEVAEMPGHPYLDKELLRQALRQAPPPTAKGFSSLGPERRLSRDFIVSFHREPTRRGRLPKCEKERGECVKSVKIRRFRPNPDEASWCDPPFMNFAVQSSVLYDAEERLLLPQDDKATQDGFPVHESFQLRRMDIRKALLACPGARVAVIDAFWTEMHLPLYRSVHFVGKTGPCPRGGGPDDCVFRIFDAFGHGFPPQRLSDVAATFARGGRGPGQLDTVRGPTQLPARDPSAVRITAKTLDALLPGTKRVTLGVETFGVTELGLTRPASTFDGSIPVSITPNSTLAQAGIGGRKRHVWIREMRLNVDGRSYFAADREAMMLVSRNAILGQSYELYFKIEEMGEVQVAHVKATDWQAAERKRRREAEEERKRRVAESLGIEPGCRDITILFARNDITGGMDTIWTDIDTCRKIIFYPSDRPDARLQIGAAIRLHDYTFQAR